MVTKRARKWLARGTLLTVLFVVGVLGAASWVLAGTIANGLLETPPVEERVAVLQIDRTRVVLAGGERSAMPGRWGLQTTTGFVEVGEVVATDESGVTRRVLRSDGVITAGMRPAFTRVAFYPDPLTRGIAFSEVLLEGPLGDMPAWAIEGSDDTWLVYIHDVGQSRVESLRVLGVARRLGLPVVVPTLRNDEGAPESDDGRGDLGAGRWRDADAAIGYALNSGAAEVVLVGLGTGGSAALLAARQSRYSSRIAGVVLDAPLIDPGVVADTMLSVDHTPSFLIGWAKAVATFRVGIDWTALDHRRTADRLTMPILIFHGDADTRFPVDLSREFADIATETELVVVPGAGHGEAWNLDPVRYETALERFLRLVAVGPSGLGSYGG